MNKQNKTKTNSQRISGYQRERKLDVDKTCEEGPVYNDGW